MGSADYRLAERIGANIRAARDAIGMTSDELGEAIGSNGGNVRRWESGYSVPTLQALLRISGATEAPLQSLLAGAGDAFAEPVERRVGIKVGSYYEMSEERMAEYERRLTQLEKSGGVAQ